MSKAAVDLLGVASYVGGEPGSLRRVFRDNVESCVRHLFRGNGAVFAKFVGCNVTSVYNWRNGATTPRIDQLLRLSERLRIPIGAFLGPCRATDWQAIQPAAAGYALPTLVHRPRGMIRRALRLMLRQRPAPSLREVARRLGYRGTEGLRRVSRSLCTQITDNYKRSFRPEPYYNGPRPSLRGRQEIEAALKAALVRDEPESVLEVARRLGYTSSAPFFGPFPALCRAIHLKVAGRKAARIRAMRRMIKRALRQDPPPTLRTLAIQLGYKDKKIFTRHFDDLRAELLARRKALAKKQVARLRRKLHRYTRAEPAPSMAEVCRRLGLKSLTARRRFPTEYQLIVSRCRQVLAGLRRRN